LVSPAGVIEGTPIGVLSTTDINQITDGASLQLNWNGEQHKLMVGAVRSILTIPISTRANGWA
jgi:hypothetical protein